MTIFNDAGAASAARLALGGLVGRRRWRHSGSVSERLEFKGMADLPTDLLKEPWLLQVTLASGYAGYALAYIGIRAHHTAVDTAFGTLVFSLVTTAMIFASKGSFHFGDGGSAAFAFFATIAMGGLWRLFGRPWLKELLRLTGVSQADEDPSAWRAMFDIQEHDITQIAVKTKDGTWLRCDDTVPFGKSLLGPCVLGTSGDVLMYMTHREKDGTTKEQTSTKNADFGDRITYIPAAEIQQVNLRWRRRR